MRFRNVEFQLAIDLFTNYANCHFQLNITKKINFQKYPCQRLAERSRAPVSRGEWSKNGARGIFIDWLHQKSSWHYDDMMQLPFELVCGIVIIKAAVQFLLRTGWIEASTAYTSTNFGRLQNLHNEPQKRPKISFIIWLLLLSQTVILFQRKLLNFFHVDELNVSSTLYLLLFLIFFRDILPACTCFLVPIITAPNTNTAWSWPPVDSFCHFCPGKADSAVFKATHRDGCKVRLHLPLALLWDPKARKIKGTAAIEHSREATKKGLTRATWWKKNTGWKNVRTFNKNLLNWIFLAFLKGFFSFKWRQFFIILNCDSFLCYTFSNSTSCTNWYVDNVKVALDFLLDMEGGEGVGCCKSSLWYYFTSQWSSEEKQMCLENALLSPRREKRQEYLKTWVLIYKRHWSLLDARHFQDKERQNGRLKC